MVFWKSAMEVLAMRRINVDHKFWSGKNIFLTGHTGFKGAWLSLWLTSMGAKVTGYSLPPATTPNLYDILNIGGLIKLSEIADIRNLEKLSSSIKAANPDIVIHMAAQPLVRFSYENPVETYSTNVMGTVNLLESLRRVESVRATVVVTTDKCYENKEWVWGYRENEAMGGYDPYSSSKGCAELVTASFRNSFFSVERHAKHKNAIASARAGNVIGGGDWSLDRLIPDAIKAFELNEQLVIRNPAATRPWQHVLEPLSGYLILAKALYEIGPKFATGWNFGPTDRDARSVQEIVEMLIEQWELPAEWRRDGSEVFHEANHLKLDCSKAKAELGWEPTWGVETAIEKIATWHKAFRQNMDMREITLSQIESFQQVM